MRQTIASWNVKNLRIFITDIVVGNFYRFIFNPIVDAIDAGIVSTGIFSALSLASVGLLYFWKFPLRRVWIVRFPAGRYGQCQNGDENQGEGFVPEFHFLDLFKWVCGPVRKHQ